MTRVFVLDVPENVGVAKVLASDAAVDLERIGPYYVASSESDIVIDRRATGCRHAVWYSCVAALGASRITQWDKDAMRIEAR